MTPGEDRRRAVGARISAIRKQRGLSLSGLAREARIGKGSLSELEGGQRNPTLDTLYAIAGPLGVPLSLLTCYHFGGYHHEHHLHPGVPWWRLPGTRARAKDAP